MSNRAPLRAFTIVEMLVVISIIGVLVAILMPAVSNARNQAKQSQSESNLRQLGTAHGSYSSEWGGRQFTLAVDNLTSYGSNAIEAVANYTSEHQTTNLDGTIRDLGSPPAIELGWGHKPGGTQQLVTLPFNQAFPKNFSVVAPISFFGSSGGPSGGDPGNDVEKMGYFRLPNARQFSQYLSGLFYDPIFYAPKDTVVEDMREEAANLPSEYTPNDTMVSHYDWLASDFCYSSYSLSPAALFSPDVMRGDNPDTPVPDGWQSPWELEAGLRAPAMDQARYPSLKTHMLEHHWLQNKRSECNEGMPEGNTRPYHGCQPYFFNHSIESAPCTLFYDGHVEVVGIEQAQRADGRARAQSGIGLWSRDTSFGPSGYFIDYGYDLAATSFHVLTTDGIKGRDFLSE